MLGAEREVAMIQSYTAYTNEIDDLELAAQEILRQLNPGENAMKNTVGILSCHCEFYFSGAMQAVSKGLPFPVVGAVTTGQAVQGQAGSMLLTVMMLTSDDVQFSTAVSDVLDIGTASAVERAYTQARDALPGQPELMLVYAPFIPAIPGDIYLDALTEVSGGVPCFGTQGVDDGTTFDHCFALMDGEHFSDRLVLLLMSGDVHPQFFIATISGDKILHEGALITSSAQNLLKEVNGHPVVEYFRDLGLTGASEAMYAMTSLPFMVDYNDGTPMVSKVFIRLDEENNALCAGIMPEGSTLYLGVFDKSDVLLTTANTLKKAMEAKNLHNMLIYSCVSRSVSLGGEILAELELMQNTIGQRFSYMAAYSGGELCPTLLRGQAATNRFHNNAFTVCVF